MYELVKKKNIGVSILIGVSNIICNNPDIKVFP